MMTYLLNSTLCMVIVLAMYQLLLSKETMYQFNRFYLLIGLLASYVIPLITIERSIDLISSAEIGQAVSSLFVETTSSTSIEIVNSGAHYWMNTLYALYMVVSLVLFLRFSYNFRSLLLGIYQSRVEKLDKCNLVLSSDNVTPYAFGNYIFVNRSAYEEGNIEPELITHEIAHVQEWHTIDVILVELLQVVFWMNPLIYFYKRAIQLNHEFIADRYVLDQQYDIRSYQNLLFENINQTSEMSLVSNLNFYITKQRLEMMTKYTSLRRANAYILMTGLLFVGLFFGFTKTEAQQIELKDKAEQTISKDDYFKDASFADLNDRGEQIYVSYDQLSESQKSMLPPPPPHPNGLRLEALPEGTKVKFDGNSIKITNKGWNPAPPAPPAPPASPAPHVPPSSVAIAAPPAPPAPPMIQAPPAPPAPPVPPAPAEFLKEMIESGAIFYLNGEKISDEKVLEIISDENSHISIRTKKRNGSHHVYIRQ